MRRSFLVLIVVVLGGVVSAQSLRAMESRVDPKTKAWEIIQQAEKAYAAVDDYIAVFEKQERVDGELKPPERFLLKFKKPFCVYIKWLERGPAYGMELIYVQGRNNDKILVHAGGLADVVMPTIEIDVHGTIAMKGNRHPITECGIGYFLERYSRDFKRADLEGEMEVFCQGVRQIDGRAAEEVEIYLYPHQAGHNYYCYRSVVYFDVENKLPIRMLFYDWENELIESYAYINLKVNTGLTDKDFDPKNSEYNFGIFPLQLGGGEEKVPVPAVLGMCDYYRHLVVTEEKEIFPFIKVPETRNYYLGYKGKSQMPVAVAGVVQTKTWFNRLRYLVGVMREPTDVGEKYRVTGVAVVNPDKALGYEDRLLKGDRFVRQFRNKSIDDPFEAGKDIDTVTGATCSVTGAAQAIRSEAAKLALVFQRADILRKAEQCPRILLQKGSTGRE